jgi:uncharacterized phage-associated protein
MIKKSVDKNLILCMLLDDNGYKGRLNVISFRFNEAKTTQIAALFIKKHGGVLNYTKLIKLLYLTDREAFLLWERPLTGDSYVSMPNGPVLSKTYDLINYEEDPENKSYWYNFISKRSYDVSLIKDPEIDELSKREIDLIEKIYQQYKDKNWKQMIDYCHENLPEWHDPGNTSIRIRIEEILTVLGKSEREIETINEDAADLRYLDFVLPAA